jgi:hypothetical protein
MKFEFLNTNHTNTFYEKRKKHMKKFVTKLVSAAAVAATLLSVPMSAGAAAHYQYGDIDHDGYIDAADASQALGLVGQKVAFKSNGKPVKDEVYYADVNGDGVITKKDSDIIMEFYANVMNDGRTLGDVNGDGDVNVADVIIANRWINSEKQHKRGNGIKINLINANVDRNSVVDENDRDLIEDFILDIITEF